jgi:hypothetical protein
MTTNGKVLIDISFNPDTRELEQVIEDAKGKPIKKKIELDKGGLEGPLKDLQEFTARLSSGGLEKGFAQLKEGVSTFKQLGKEGADMSTAVAGGLSKLGTEASAFISVAVATAAGIVAIGAAGVAAAFSLSEFERQVARTTFAMNGITQATNGFITQSNVALFANAALNTGFRASQEQLQNLSVAATRYAKLTGVDATQASQLYAQALSGSREAAEALGISLNGVTTQAGVTAAVLRQAQQEAAQGAGTQTLGEQWDELVQNIKDYGQAIGDFFGMIIRPVVQKVLDLAGTVFRFLGQMGRDFSREIAEWLNPQGFADFQRRIRDMEEQRRVSAARRAELSAFEERNARNALAYQRSQLDALNLGIPILGNRANLEQLISAAKLDYIKLQRLATTGDVEAIRMLQDAGERLIELTQQSNQEREASAQRARERRQREEQEFAQLMEKERQLREQALQREIAYWARIAAARAAAESAQNQAALNGIRQTQQQLTLNQMREESTQREFALAERALEKQRQGIELTNSETSALAQYNTLLAQREQLNTINEARISQVQSRLRNENLTLEERISLEQELNTHIQQRNTYEQETLDRQQRSQQLTGTFGRGLQSLAKDYRTIGQAAEDLALGGLTKFGNAMGQAFGIILEGGDDIGVKLQNLLKQTLASIAQEAAVQAIFQTAKGFALLANPATAPLATQAFTSAGIFATVAGVAGGISAAIPSAEAGKTAKENTSSASMTASSPTEEESKTGPVVINLNVRPFSTKEDIEDAIWLGMRGAERRRRS